MGLSSLISLQEAAGWLGVLPGRCSSCTSCCRMESLSATSCKVSFKLLQVHESFLRMFNGVGLWLAAEARAAVIPARISSLIWFLVIPQYCCVAPDWRRASIERDRRNATIARFTSLGGKNTANVVYFRSKRATTFILVVNLFTRAKVWLQLH